MRFLQNYLLVGLIFLGSLLGVVSCSTMEKSSDTPEGAFAIAQEFDKEERYDEAIKRYQDVKNKFPYSKVAVAAELAIADAYFKQESFAEAQISYQAFRDMRPKHQQIDYVVFRLGMSMFKQLPATIDRDLSLAPQVVAIFSELVTNYPSSQYVSEAQDKREQTLKMLAAKEEYIADFYFKRGYYQSALDRYRRLLKMYPGLGFDSKAQERIAICASKSKNEEPE